MCGISVWIKSSPINKRRFVRYNDAVSHRGPDAEGTQYQRCGNYYVALGHRRLSILDLHANANQPMTDGQCAIVYNGEIYNYLEIRKELESAGCVFQTAGDTEVILQAYQTWGTECLPRFNGMFSFAIMDTFRQRLFIARDRFGIKPLYYYSPTGEQLYIASEIKQIVQLEGFKPTGNINAVGNFIENRYVDYSEETFFKGVYQLKGGDAAVISLKRPITIEPYRWYDLPEAFRAETKGPANYFYQLFRDSVGLRLRSDVEVGSCLSGGLDSTSIVCTAAGIIQSQGGHHPVKTITSSFDDKRFDERDYVKATRNRVDIDTRFVFPRGKDFFQDVERLIYSQDEPVWSSSIYAQREVFSGASENGIKVMLDGQGADEVFCGYANIFYPSYFRSLNLFRKIGETLSPRAYRTALKLLLCDSKAKQKRPQLKILKTPYDNRRQTVFPNLHGHTEHFVRYHLPALLHYEDRNSMAFSVESRLPFLDHRLVEFGLSLDDRHKIGGRIGKRIIREAMAGKIPAEVLNRKDKMGFVTPQVIWLNSRVGQVLRRINSLRSLGIFHNSHLDYLSQKYKSGTYDSGLIMRLFTFAVWCDVFNIQIIH